MRMINYRGTDPERHVELLQEVIVLRDKEIETLQARVNELSEVLTNEGLKTRRQLKVRIAVLENEVRLQKSNAGGAYERIAELEAALTKCHQAALPDPYDERDIDVHWLTRTILKITRKARRGK